MEGTKENGKHITKEGTNVMSLETLNATIDSDTALLVDSTEESDVVNMVSDSNPNHLRVNGSVNLQQRSLVDYFGTQQRTLNDLRENRLYDHKCIKEFREYCTEKGLTSERDNWANWFDNSLPVNERAFEVLVCMMLTNRATSKSVGNVMNT